MLVKPVLLSKCSEDKFKMNVNWDKKHCFMANLVLDFLSFEKDGVFCSRM